jgi:phospholipid/cholesterol/gamma-HCH transport system permease protein
LIEKLIYFIGAFFISLFDKSIVIVGKLAIFQLEVIKLLFTKKFRVKETLKQIEFIGVNSFLVIFLTAFFTGMVEAIQLYDGFKRFGIESFMGYTIFLSICKELGPVFASLMVVSRAVSSMAAELGTMRVTEQIDALDVMAVNSKHYLVVPRVLATIISLPLLILMFDAIANIGSYLVAVYLLDINSHAYLDTIRQFAEFGDFTDGLIKGLVFGYLIAMVGTYSGYFTRGGAKGVGRSTTSAVVVSSILVFISDYVISAILMIVS